MKRYHLIILVLAIMLYGCHNKSSYQYLTFNNQKSAIVIKAFNNHKVVEKLVIKNAQIDSNFNIYQDKKDVYFIIFTYKGSLIKRLNKNDFTLSDISQFDEHPTFFYLNNYLYYSSNYLQNNYIIAQKNHRRKKIKVGNYFVNKINLNQKEPFMILEDDNLNDYIFYKKHKIKIKGNVAIASDILYRNRKFYFISHPQDTGDTLLYRYDTTTAKLSFSKIRRSFSDFTILDNQLLFIDKHGIYDDTYQPIAPYKDFNKITFTNHHLILNSNKQTLVLNENMQKRLTVPAAYIVYL